MDNTLSESREYTLSESVLRRILRVSVPEYTFFYNASIEKKVWLVRVNLS